MRVKIETSCPLPKHNCWFAITEKLVKQTIHHLKKKLVRSLFPSIEAVQISLSIDNFDLLPQCKIQDLVRDGDLITIKEVRAPTSTLVKRKLVDEDKKEKKRVKKAKVVKSSKKSTSKSGKKEEVKKRKNSKKEEKRNQNDSKKEEKKQQKDSKKEDKSSEKTKAVTKKAIKDKKAIKEKKKISMQRSPFEGSPATKKRNRRRKILKQLYRAQRAASQQEATQQAAASEEADSIVSSPAENTLSPVEEQEVHPEETPVQVETHIEQLDISSTSTQLIKQNKNKKKDHLKGPKVENRTHQYFYRQIEVPPDPNRNNYGRAFITVAETEASPRSFARGTKFSYPIHSMPTLFYAGSPNEQQDSAEDSANPENDAEDATDSNEEVEDDHAQDVSDMECDEHVEDNDYSEAAAEEMAAEEVTPEEMAAEEMAAEKVTPEEMAAEEVTPEEANPEEATPEYATPEIMTPEVMTPEVMTPEEATPEEATPEEATPEEATPVDYDKLPDADFVTNIPNVGDELAIKTLEMAANYTPQISEWQEVVLIEVDLPNAVVIEYKKGFGKTSTKGGKFDNKKHEKRHYDDWYQDEQAEEEEEERVTTIAPHDIFAMKKMGSVVL